MNRSSNQGGGRGISCQHCKAPLAELRDGKLKIQVRKRIVAVRSDGGVEITCHHCSRSTDLPLRHVDAPDAESAR